MNLTQRTQPDLTWLSELDRFFNPGRSLAAHAPAPEAIYETPDAWVLRLDLPGFAKEDVTLQVTGQTLQLTGRTQAERPFSSKVDRQWKLGTRIDQNNVQARLENGVLEITLPKIEAPEPRTIEVH